MKGQNGQIVEEQEALKKATGIFSWLWDKAKNYFPTLLVALCVFLIGMLLAHLLTKLLHRTMHRSRISPTAAGFGQSLVRILLYAVLVIICLSILGVPTASMITVIGAAGVTIGLALQNALSNFAGGFVILFSKPFKTGDYIQVGQHLGYVESMSILYTELRTRDNQHVFLPNGSVSSGSVVNFSKRGYLRVPVRLSVAYSADLRTVRKVLMQEIGRHPIVLREPKPLLLFTALGDNGVGLVLYVWVRLEHFFTVESEILEASKYALEAAGIEIPFPQLDIHKK